MHARAWLAIPTSPMTVNAPSTTFPAGGRSHVTGSIDLTTLLGDLLLALVDLFVKDRGSLFGLLQSRLVEGKEADGVKFKDYFEHSEALSAT